MELKNGQKQGRDERTQEDYPTQEDYLVYTEYRLRGNIGGH